jgi:hypothetical protein
LLQIGGGDPLFKGVGGGYREFVNSSNQVRVQSMMQDTDRSSSACQPVAVDAAGVGGPHDKSRNNVVFSWRHAATVVLILVTFPVLLLAAGLTLPLLLLFLCAEGVRKVLELDPPLPLGEARAPSH